MTDRADEPSAEPDYFYEHLNLDVSYFPAMWRTFTIGQLLATDLNRVCALYDLSIADVNAIGAIREHPAQQLRATDLAQILHVSNAVLSPRIAKLEKKDLLTRIPSAADRRAFELKLTPKGVKLIDEAIADINRHARFVRCYRKLNEQDRANFERIISELFTHMD